MNRPEQPVDDRTHVALTRLVTEVAWRIDHGRADAVWELFVADGILKTSATPLIGHDAIRQWGVARNAATTRTRHICSGMRFVHNGNEQIVGTTVITVFVDDTQTVGSSLPRIVGEDTDVFRSTEQGWKFVSRTFETLFDARFPTNSQ